MLIILKLVIFYGGALAALMATVFLWLFWRPKLKVEVMCDDSARMIRCAVRATRTLSPITLTRIWIPVEYAEALGASPPGGFREKFDRFTPTWPYDSAKREIIVWSGRLEVARGQTIDLSIPANHPKAISGTLQLFYEYRGLGGVLMSFGSVEAALNKPDA